MHEIKQLRLWYVYELVDPRGPAVFYIGKTNSPKGRFAAHLGNPASAAFQRLQEIAAHGAAAAMNIVGKFQTEAECLEYEAHLINQTPGLVNRTGRSLDGDAAPPRRQCFAPPRRTVGQFDGVLQIHDAIRLWRMLNSTERRVIVDILALDQHVKRGLGYPIIWSYRGGGGQIVVCRISTLERLKRRGLLRFHGKTGREFALSPLGKFVAANGPASPKLAQVIERIA